MFTGETPKIVSRLYDIIEASERALQERFACEKHQRQGELALFFLNAAGERVLYFGVWYELWSRSGSPLWYGVKSDWQSAAVETFLQRHPEALPFEDYRLCRVDDGLVFDDEDTAAVARLLSEELELLEAGC